MLWPMSPMIDTQPDHGTIANTCNNARLVVAKVSTDAIVMLRLAYAGSYN
jgi:hypothetical protein